MIQESSLETPVKATIAIPHVSPPYCSALEATKGIAIKCLRCKEILYVRAWERNLKVCSYCGYHFRLAAYERIEYLVDAGSFIEQDMDVISADPLHFASQSQVYAEKLVTERQKLGIRDAVICGRATIKGMPLALAVMDFRFIGGSMGVAVGEKITRTIEMGIEQRIPVITVSASGGARMQEGMYSLLQMGKISVALARLGKTGLPHISILTDPTTGGVTASFAMLGDVILAEPGGLICFAGPRVIEQFMHTKLPTGAVTSEFALQHGLLDAIIHRSDLHKVMARLLRFFALTSIPAIPYHEQSHYVSTYMEA